MKDSNASDGRIWPTTPVALLAIARDAQSQAARCNLFEIYAPLIYRYARKRGVQAADAQDIMQNVFCRLEKALPHFIYDPARGRFRGWLGTVTYRELRHFQRRAANAGVGHCVTHPLLEDIVDECAEDVEPEWVDEFNEHILRLALRRIRPEFDAETWRAFEAVWIDDLAPHQVAAQIQKKPAWIYKAKFRVLQRLKTEIVYLAGDAPWLQK
ncbi:MAG: sigma-70 family RNA polymerase sigma factor [Planctomycetales bacterium]|nr:sigma-70 family RNA polymerase sigma factor [Planctomycetales bacterium]